MKRKPYARRITLPKGSQPKRCAYCRWPRYEGNTVYQRVDGNEVFCSTVCSKYFREGGGKPSEFSAGME